MEDREAGQPVVVRWAKEEEWAPAMQMVWRTFLKFEGRDYTEEGIKNFFDFIVTSGLVWTYDSDIIVTEKECFGNKGDK